MPNRQLLLLIGLCVLSPGCNLAALSTRNLVLQPLQTLDNGCMCSQNNERAREAWQEVQADSPDADYSRAYAHGFKRGFADYLESGGSAEPPPVVPWWFRTTLYQSPAGHDAIADWYAGFRHGAGLAKQSEMRERDILIPLSRPFDPDQRPYLRGGMATRMDAESPMPALPMPRPLPPALPPRTMPPDLPPGERVPADGKPEAVGANTRRIIATNGPVEQSVKAAEPAARPTAFAVDRLAAAPLLAVAFAPERGWRVPALSAMPVRLRAQADNEERITASLGPPVADE